VTCSNTAEFSAILAGVARALAEWDDVEGIQVNTDSQTAISYLKFSAELSQLRRKEWLVFRTRLYTMLDKRNCKIQFKHVKGHQRPTHVRAYINDRVDALARKKNK
jgi:ribonuclease HI